MWRIETGRTENSEWQLNSDWETYMHRPQGCGPTAIVAGGTEELGKKDTLL